MFNCTPRKTYSSLNVATKEDAEETRKQGVVREY